jgi:hypothetical protein
MAARPDLSLGGLAWAADAGHGGGTIQLRRVAAVVVVNRHGGRPPLSPC